ncbi:MAG: ATP-dependent Clp protease proteolytic subunit [Saccharofermentans sp.]|nr:ATP-dependent Clp protease proteolytic subunit [Saccharofermentans sp.]
MHNSTYIFQPYLIKESAHGYTPITLETELLNNQRKIFLTEEINTQSAISVIKQLMVLDSSDDPSPIKLYISSPGGSVSDGLAIYDTMQSMEKKIDVYCVGAVMSMAAVLYCAASGKRYIYSNAKLMIHDPLINETGGNALQLKSISDRLLEYRETIGKLLARSTGKSLEEIYELTAKDTYINAEDCVKNHFADEIINSEVNI